MFCCFGSMPNNLKEEGFILTSWLFGSMHLGSVIAVEKEFLHFVKRGARVRWEMWT